jgi:hypothetical protein
LRYGFEAASAPLVMVPAEDSKILIWLRNQYLCYAYLALYFSSYWVFLGAQLFYDDGTLFVTFWEHMLSLEPFM